MGDPSQVDEAIKQTRRVPANLRDLGGLRTINGRRTRSGVLYRSDAPMPGDHVPSMVSVWPPPLVVDLRSPGEADVEYPWPDAIDVHRMPILSLAGAAWRPRRGIARVARSLPTRLDAVYAKILDKASVQLVSIFRLAANTNGPMLVHCTAGKDRTGVAAALLLLAAGTDPGDVVDDYLATGPNLRSILGRLAAGGHTVPLVGEPPPALRVSVDAINVVIDRLTGWPGGAAGWLVDRGASPQDIDRWAERLVDRNDAHRVIQEDDSR